ncbi:MAG: aKG-HExxH-type peptide beta-hydroxylase [Alphaproteobacteria bacterium]
MAAIMADSFAFAPDPVRAARLDARMHEGLAESLEHLCERTAELDGFDHVSVMSVARAVRRCDRFPPVAFGRYYELAFALVSGEFDAAKRASCAFAGLQPTEGGLQILSLGDPAFENDAEMIRRRIGLNAEERYLDPPADMAASFKTCLTDGLTLMDRALPPLAGELRAMVRQFVLATGRSYAEYPFDGASIYQLWGMVVLNPRVPKTPVEIVETLAHEGAHTLLFGLTYDEPLVLNHDTELYHSPLRQDPRPMDGVYHATFVSARMHWAMSALSDCADLSEAQRAEAAAAADYSKAAFRDGLAVVDAHGRLSDTGKALMEGATNYMKSV